MPKLIKDKAIIEDSWVKAASVNELKAGGQFLLPLQLWLDNQDQLQAFDAGSLGVIVPNDTEIETVAPALAKLAVIAIEFPSFTDGRGYSLARLLRERFGFQGELRAVGDVWRDQIYYLWRCGFNAFEIKAGKSIEDALAGFDDFSVNYQGAAVNPHPIYRRRVAS